MSIDVLDLTDPAAMLRSLRGAPPIGSWVPEHPHGCWPGNEGFITRADARAEARRRGWSTIGRVVATLHGWTTAHSEWAGESPAAIRRARRARRRALLRRIREDRRPTGGRWYGRRILPADEEWLSRFVIIGTLEVA